MRGFVNVTGLLSVAASCVVVLHPSSPNFFVQASNFNKPHSHTGKVEPFQPGDPNVKLDGKAKSILKSGKPYQVRFKHITSHLMSPYFRVQNILNLPTPFHNT
jgi:hypothetical protein